MFFGGIAAVVASYFIEKYLIAFLPPEFAYCVGNSPLCRTDSAYTIWILALASFAIVGPVEEVTKFLAAYLISYRSPAFTRIIDGAKFGVAVALGFAAAENALYLFSSLKVLDLNTFVSTFLLRFALSTLAHTLYSGMFGYYLGKAQFQRYGRFRLILIGLFLATVTHGLFDFVLFSQVGFYAIIILFFLFAAIYVRFKQPENFAIRIPEFMRGKPQAARSIIKVPVEGELQPAYAGLGTILSEIPEELRPITPQDIKPEYLPDEVPSEFASHQQEAPVKKVLKVPTGTVPTRHFTPISLSNIGVSRKKPIATANNGSTRQAEAPAIAVQINKETAQEPLTSESVTSIVRSSVDDVRRRRLRLLPKETQALPA